MYCNLIIDDLYNFSSADAQYMSANKLQKKIIGGVFFIPKNVCF